jgi:hypothetical protein
MRKIFPFLLLCISSSILNAQSVGIGTTIPNAKAQLDVESINKGILIPRMTATQRTAIAPTAAEAGLMVYETTTNSFWFFNGSVWNQIGSGGVSPWTVSGSNVYNSNTGNVGIGLTSNINKKFTVKGDALFVYPGTTNVNLSLMANTNGVARINFIKPDSSVLGSVYTSDILDRLYLQQGTNTNQLVLHSNGFIGINMNGTPSEVLDIVGNIRSRDTIRADNDIEAGVDIRAGDDIIAAGTISGAAVNSTGVLTVTGNSVVGGTGFVNGEISTNTGITINNAAGTLSFRTAGDDKGFVQLSGDNLRVGTYGTNTNGKFVIRTGGGDRVHVDPNGNMGLGIADPLSKIHIASGSDAGLSSHGYLMLGPVTGSNLIFDNNEIIARTNGQTGSLILQNDGGSVRIGNVAVPGGYKFAINGKMVCEEVKVKLASSGWPDYVFADNYKLKPLQEIEKFIIQNKHLPNIPSAAEVEKNGIEVGDMQKRMMEKIEELTLYVIELEKKVNDLKNAREK